MTITSAACVRAFDRRRVGAVALVTLLLSVGVLASSNLLDFFSPAEITLAWLEHLVELAVLAAVLTIAYTLLDEAMRDNGCGYGWRSRAWCCLACPSC